MQSIRKAIAAIGLAGAVCAPSVAWLSSASASTTETCTTKKVAVTHLVKVTEKVTVKGKAETKTVEKREDVRHNVKVRVAYKVKVGKKTVTRYKIVVRSEIKYKDVTTCVPVTATATAPTTSSTAAASTTATTASSGSTTATTPAATTPAPSPVIVLVASIDPSYVQSSTDPYDVTWSYSASAQETSDGIEQDDPSLPDGVLELFSNGSLVQSSDVGGATTSASATVTYTSWGDQSVDVVYDSGTSSGTTGDETYDIEPPAPSPMVDTWGTDSPTAGASIAATVSEDETSDDVTLTDANFEGAQSVTLTDNNGNACTATVSGTTAECTMDSTATPTSFTVGYPGGTTTTQTVDPYGIDQSQEVEWPSEQVTISNPSVTTPETTDVSETISQIDSIPIFLDGGGPDGTTGPAVCLPNGPGDPFPCAAFGVQGLPAEGTVTITIESDATGDSAVGETCTIDLATSQVCYLLTSLTDSDLSDWTVSASWSGYTSSGYDTTVYSAPTVTYSMTPTGGGDSSVAAWYPTPPAGWYTYAGSAS